MIKFFRRIRQKLIASGSLTKYLLYAIGEIMLVVIGILIALQINNWNEKKKAEQRTLEYYSQLMDDLKSDQDFANRTRFEFNSELGKYESYVNMYYSNEILKPVQVYKQISKLSLITNPMTFNSSTLESLQNSGDIRLIPANIRNRLIDLKRLQNLTMDRFDITDDGARTITQRVSTLIGSTTLIPRLEYQPEVKEFLNIDENLKELILVYEGIHRWREVSFQEAIIRLDTISREIDVIIKLINTELEN